jgi:hypothetical protein
MVYESFSCVVNFEIVAQNLITLTNPSSGPPLFFLQHICHRSEWHLTKLMEVQNYPLHHHNTSRASKPFRLIGNLQVLLEPNQAPRSVVHTG